MRECAADAEISFSLWLLKPAAETAPESQLKVPARRFDATAIVVRNVMRTATGDK
jgi:hypothetical protein